ncbi:hypothetical protein [Anaerocolumna xylanovorans]|uniref:Uncharacterized protein n=1 Tax=Anaerocolumna xylanovorans DSM 12503 TaxID=1121345 RepID=A0A1M7YDQ0_9FIRM|nr:hypothetical protein [Anaerocolumna xylanovorans]SHO50767.1 hypothetical protein SAMN02745217_02884 [Anaerocolumna xylanovorans DSM 12503]
MYGNTKVKRTPGKWKRNDIIILLLMVMCVFLIMERNVIFAEGNPLLYIKPMFILATGKDYTEIERKDADNNKEKVYLTKRNGQDELFVYLEKTYQLEYKEQNGGSYLFEGADGEKVLTGRRYLKYYIVWRISDKS